MTKPDVTRQSIVDFLRQKHGPNFSDETLQPLIEGMESRAFTYEVGDERHVIRINLDALGFQKDRFAAEHFGTTLPIPAVFEIGTFDDHHAYCISAWLTGETLEALNEREVERYLEPTLDMLLKIKAGPVSQFVGFGPFDTTCQAAHATWRDYLLSFVNNSGLDWQAVANSGFDLTQLESCFAEYRRLVDTSPEARNLIHGDFGSNNVLVENGVIIGVLDWDCAAVGDYLYDVATAYYWSHHLICMKKQAAYYERKLTDHEPNFHERVRCYELTHWFERAA